MTVGGVVLRERFGLDNLGGVRGRVRQASLAAGLRPDLAENLTTATAEGMANAIMHGGRTRTVTVSVIEDVGVVAEVHDNGLADEFGPPSHAPPSHCEGGRGLLLARALCDRVSVSTGCDGTALLLEVDYDGQYTSDNPVRRSRG
jgi:anti-sigma regulatory factor (Ser/Thr protein kinase)